jgi:hypothetical protein
VKQIYEHLQIGHRHGRGRVDHIAVAGVQERLASSVHGAYQHVVERKHAIVAVLDHKHVVSKKHCMHLLIAIDDTSSHTTPEPPVNAAAILYDRRNQLWQGPFKYRPSGHDGVNRSDLYTDMHQQTFFFA